MSMKKLLALLLCLAMVLSLAACGGGSKQPDQKEEAPTEEADKTEAEEPAEEEPEEAEEPAEEEPAEEAEEPAEEEPAEEAEEPAEEEPAEEPEEAEEASETDAEEPAEAEAAEVVEDDSGTDAEEPEGEPVDISLWVYPVGNWGDEATVDEIIAGFNEEYPNINVTVEYLDYTNGDATVDGAITGKKAPDIVMEAPERLVANWGQKGVMLDLADIWDENDEAEVFEGVKTACFTADGELFVYPAVMTAHCMAINYDAFVEAGADQYVDLETRTWTTDDFKAAVEALTEKFGGPVGAVYCSGQGGDQGTRALIANLYGGTITDGAQYIAASEENAKALEELAAMEGISFDASIAGGDEIALFYNETLKMAFCWNAAQQMNPNSAGTGEGLTINGQKIEYMAFPSDDGVPSLEGGMWGFGIFSEDVRSGDDVEARTEAAKAFIKYVGDTQKGLEATVKAANFFACRDTVDGEELSGIWADNEIMSGYTTLLSNLGPYYQVTPGWTEARTAWWNMLQQVGTGADPMEALEEYDATANAAAGVEPAEDEAEEAVDELAEEAGEELVEEAVAAAEAALAVEEAEEPEEDSKETEEGKDDLQEAIDALEQELAGEEEAEEPEEEAAEEPEGEPVDISLWVYPVGNWGDEATVDEIIAGFNEEYPNINVTVEYLDYTNGDATVDGAITGKKAPDIVMEAPERLVANWGQKGVMLDLADIWDENDEAEVFEGVKTACFTADGELFVYPAVMTAHCMAINYDAFVEAGADQYVDLETRTWTTDDFKAAVEALTEKFGGPVGAVYCSGQGGDQGTRALIANLYGGTITDGAQYIAASEENAKALEELAAMEGISFDASIAGGDEIALFYNETLKMAFCWNAAQQMNPNSAGTGEGLTINGQKIEYMAFPSDDGVPSLEGGMWGFGIFSEDVRSGDDVEARTEAAKAFIKYVGDTQKGLEATVKAANFFACRDTVDGEELSGIWADNEIMSGYTTLLSNLGPYYQVTPGWTEARTAWWNMLQQVGTGTDPMEALEEYDATANAAAGVEPAEDEAEEAVDELAEEAGEELVEEAVAAAEAALAVEEAEEPEEDSKETEEGKDDLQEAIDALEQELAGEEEAEEPEEEAAEEPEGEPVDISLWVYPVGNWGDEATVDEIIAGFNEEYPNINVTVEYLDYTNGDATVDGAITGKKAPDIVMEAPERLVANWGQKGVMLDLADIWDENDEAEVFDGVKTACFTADGELFVYPAVMTAHCMAINYDAFVEAGADQYVDLETRTWTTDDFKAAVEALTEKFGGPVGAVYCSGQGGDQGTRALIANLYGGTITDGAQYIAASEENAKALEELAAMEGISFDASIAGGDEIALFYNETLKMAFCWNAAQQMNPNSAGTGEGLTINGQKIEYMAFPSDDGVPSLEGGMWGFGIFSEDVRSGDDVEARTEAAKAFIKYVGDTQKGLEATVKAANFFACRDTVDGEELSGIWADNEIMSGYTTLLSNLGPYYQVTPGWTEARTAWWNMLQQVGTGTDPMEALEEYDATANAAAGN